ncbi:MAG: HAD family phosphatase [Candidatus ainarchaeum sp.]|nr:HAD family phosphatase [Candidatus ainarchaeum sp.]
MIRAVLFDFDGVVVQSERLHMDSFLELLSPFGVNVSEERWYREFAGTGSRSIIERLAKEYNIKTDIGELVEKRKNLYEAKIRKGELRETPGVKAFLETIRKKGIKTAIVSGSHSSNVALAISTLGLDGLFDLIVSGDDIDIRKPDPGPFLHAAKKLDMKPSECLVIEDSYAGCESARRAGMRLVVVRSPASKGLYGFDAIIDDFSEFPLEMFEHDKA